MVNFSVFNELSLPLNSVNEFDEFFKILGKLRDLGFDKIRMEKKFQSYTEILPNTTFEQLLGTLKDRDKKTRLKRFISNNITIIESPLIFKDENESDLLLENEYFYNDISNKGALACCDIWNTIMISFRNKIDWDEPIITINKESIEFSDREKIYIKNISNLEHISHHKSFFDEFSNFMINRLTANNFWSEKETIFKDKIIFCASVKSQVKNLDSNIFIQVIGILRSIEVGLKTLADYTTSPESKSVAQTPSLRQLREFLVDGKKEYFENHIKNLSNGYRIHYLEKDNKIYIGYIGKHLSTQKYK